LISLFVAAAVSVSASARNFYIPIAGSAPGKGGTYWTTDVRLFNPSSEELVITIHFLPLGLDNHLMSGQVFKIAPRQVVILNDAANALYGWDPPLIGSLRIDSDTAADYNLLVTSRTYTKGPGVTGTFGQFIPALDVNDARRKTVVMHVVSTGDFRTNAVIMNPQRTATHVVASLALPDGTLLAAPKTITVQPMSAEQFYVPETFALTRAVDDAFLYFDADQPVFTGASIIDNRSADPFFVPGLEDKDEVKPLPSNLK
jgi:hypothetical protein